MHVVFYKQVVPTGLMATASFLPFWAEIAQNADAAFAVLKIPQPARTANVKLKTVNDKPVFSCLR
jgi:hypothetical protein